MSRIGIRHCGRNAPQDRSPPHNGAETTLWPQRCVDISQEAAMVRTFVSASSVNAKGCRGRVASSSESFGVADQLAVGPRAVGKRLHRDWFIRSMRARHLVLFVSEWCEAEYVSRLRLGPVARIGRPAKIYGTTIGAVVASVCCTAFASASNAGPEVSDTGGGPVANPTGNDSTLTALSATFSSTCVTTLSIVSPVRI